jgi:hypothetical protein
MQTAPGYPIPENPKPTPPPPGPDVIPDIKEPPPPAVVEIGLKAKGK